jgi:hypothetical protein
MKLECWLLADWYAPCLCCTHVLILSLLPHWYLQARIAALLKENPAAGQSFCRMLVAPFIHYMDSGKGRVSSVQEGLMPQREYPCIFAYVKRHGLDLNSGAAAAGQPCRHSVSRQHRAGFKLASAQSPLRFCLLDAPCARLLASFIHPLAFHQYYCPTNPVLLPVQARTRCRCLWRTSCSLPAA